MAQTTVVFGTIPRSHSADDLVKFLDANGYRWLYDLVHVPMYPGFRENRGYAYVNFTRADVAQRFLRSPPPLWRPWASWSKQQGYVNLRRHLRSLGAIDHFGPARAMPALMPRVVCLYDPARRPV
jgi:hypothetical protein